MSLKIVNTLAKGLNQYFKIMGISNSPATGANLQGQIAVGLTLLNWTVNGSPNEPVVPPIKDGILRGSGSVFVDSRFYGSTGGEYPGGNPNKSYSGKANILTIGFNTAYAARMHETNWNPGATSQKSENVGNKFVQRHIQADGKMLMQVYAAKVKKVSGG